MVSRKKVTSCSDRFMPSCLPTATSSEGVGSFTLAMGDLLGCAWGTPRRPGNAALDATRPYSRHPTTAWLAAPAAPIAHRVGEARRLARRLTESAWRGHHSGGV